MWTSSINRSVGGRLAAAVAAASLGIMIGDPAVGAQVRAGAVIATTDQVAVGADVVLNVLAKTNLLVSIGGSSAQTVASLSIPKSLTVPAIATDEVRLPAQLTAPTTAGGITAPNSVALSIADQSPAKLSGADAADGTMMIVIQFN